MTDATAVNDPFGGDMPPRTASQLSAEQRLLVQRSVAAHKKVERATAARTGAVAARDDLIRQTLEAGVGETMLSRELGVNRGLIWKIKRGLTTREYERRRGGGT